MKTWFHKMKVYIMYLMGMVFVLPLFIGLCTGKNDLLQDLFEPAKLNQTYIDLGDKKESVGNKIFRGSTELGAGVTSSGSIIVKVTRLLLMLTVALSITMILYNGMMYIIQTGQGKEGKSLMSNVLLIVVGIFVSLFSVVAINLIQSIPDTLEEELTKDKSIDQEAIKGKAMSYKDFFKKLGDNITDGWKEFRDSFKNIFSNGNEDVFDVIGDISYENNGDYSITDSNGSPITITEDDKKLAMTKLQQKASEYWKTQGYSPYSWNGSFYINVLTSYESSTNITTGSVEIIEEYFKNMKTIHDLQNLVNFDVMGYGYGADAINEYNSLIDKIEKNSDIILMAMNYYYNKGIVEFSKGDDGKWYFKDNLGNDVNLVYEYLSNILQISYK